jgi:hypothetical protein
VHSDEYSRLSAACLVMAGQSNLPDVRARWLTLAKDCKDLVVGSGAKGARLTTRSSVDLRAANVQ